MIDEPLRNFHCFLISSPFPLTEEFLNDSTCGPARTDVRAVIDEPRLNTGIRQCHCAEIPTDPSQPVLQIMNMGALSSTSQTIQAPAAPSRPTSSAFRLILTMRFFSDDLSRLRQKSKAKAPRYRHWLSAFRYSLSVAPSTARIATGRGALSKDFPRFPREECLVGACFFLPMTPPRSVGRHRGDPTCISAVGHCPFEARRKESQSAASIQTGVRSSRPAKSHRAAAGRHAGGGARAS